MLRLYRISQGCPGPAEAQGMAIHGSADPFRARPNDDGIGATSEHRDLSVVAGAGRDPVVPGATRDKRSFRHPLVEAVRLIMVALFATAGWEVATRTGPDAAPRLAVGIALGSGVGFVIGGMIGRRTATA